MNNNNTYCQGNKERNKEGGKEKTKQYCEKKKNSFKSTPKININNY